MAALERLHDEVGDELVRHEVARLHLLLRNLPQLVVRVLGRRAQHPDLMPKRLRTELAAHEGAWKAFMRLRAQYSNLMVPAHVAAAVDGRSRAMHNPDSVLNQPASARVARPSPVPLDC